MTTRSATRWSIFGKALFVSGALLSASISSAQAAAPGPTSPHRVLDTSVMYAAERTKLTYGDSFWLQGASFDAAFPLFHGVGIALDLSGGSKGSLAPGTFGFSKIALVAGPRYTHHFRRSRLFAEALFGGVHAFNGIFPSARPVYTSADSFAMQMGGGYDLDWKKRLSIRPVALSYIRTTLPNGIGNGQNDLRITAGVVLRLPCPQRLCFKASP